MKVLKLLCLVLPLTLIAAGFKSEPEKVNEFNKSLLQAAADGNIEQVKSLLSKGAEINARDERGLTPLHHAASRGHNDIVDLLIAKGADTNGKDKGGYTPLYYAIWNEDKDMVSLLVAKGADVSFTREKGYPPLHYAVWNEDREMVELFVANGAKFDFKDQDGWTAFRYAAWQGSRDMVEFFVSKGADVSTFHLAACVGDLDRVKGFIQQGTDIDTKDEMDWTPLYWAASMGQEDVAEFLIAKGADVGAKAEDSSTPLHQVSRAGSVKLVKLLISKDADVKANDKRANTPLHSAVSTGHREVVELLIAKGANVDAKGRNDWTPLHNAARQGHKDVVELLLANGADINAKDKQGRTALWWANRRGHKEIVELLHKHADEKEKQTVPSSFSGRREKQPVADLIFTGEAPGDAFGDYLDAGKDVNGDGHKDIVVGSPRCNSEKGRAWLFYGGPNTDTKPDMVFNGEKVGDRFGSGVLLTKLNADRYHDVIVGAPGYDSQRGRLYVFYGGPEMDTIPDKILDIKDPNSRFGGLCKQFDDLNGDNRADLVVSALGWDQYRGRVYIFYGSSGEINTTPDIILDGENLVDRFGRHHAIGKDVNGDGHPDLIVGAEFWPNDGKQGRAYLYYGGPDMDTKPDMIFTGEGGRFGNFVELHDIDNDGFTDVIIGAPHLNRGMGRVYLYFGGPDMDNVADRIFDPEPSSIIAGWGCSIACGDMNKDGYKDIALGCTAWAQLGSGVCVYYGGPGRSMDLIPDKVIIEEEMPEGYLGVWVKLADHNGDGFDDLLAGDWKYNSNQGRVYLYYGGPDN